MIQKVNDRLFRLALVVNTSHSKFNDNLASIIVYVLYLNREKKAVMSVAEIEESIRSCLGLEFTLQEITQCLKANTKLFYNADPIGFSLSETGAKAVREDRPAEMDRVFYRYKEVYKIASSIEELSKLLYGFLYNCLGQSIADLLHIVSITSQDNMSELAYDGYNNEERKIINDFIDWDDNEKNDLLFQLISFAVDYCRLTVKKDAKNFNTLLQGKVFYLDANIIFRMMGLNNVQRQSVVLRFIDKCKDSGIKLCYTSLTRQEVLESIHYHVSSIKKDLQYYHGKGSAINKVYKTVNGTDGFMEAYLNWCGETSGYGKYDDFEKSLKANFYQCVSGIVLEDVLGVNASQEEIDSYFNAKAGNTSRETAEYDIKNVHYVLKRRERNTLATGWNTKEYLISADHKLIDWASRSFSQVNPVVVLPSVWYSIILKITGRSNNDESSFVEFIKLRYMQKNTDDNVRYLISEICNKTSDGVLQDVLFTEISEDNELANRLSNAQSEAIPAIVEQTYENVIESTRNEGFIKGRNTGYSEGKSDGIEKGEQIGCLKQRKMQLENTVIEKAISIHRRNKWIVFALTLAVLVGAYFLVRYLGDAFFEKYNNILSVIIPILVTGPVGYVITKAFPIDLEKIKTEEHIRVEAELNKIDSELSLLEKG